MAILSRVGLDDPVAGFADGGARRRRGPARHRHLRRRAGVVGVRAQRREPWATSTSSTSCAGWPGCAPTSRPTAASRSAAWRCAATSTWRPRTSTCGAPPRSRASTHVTPEERAAVGELEALGPARRVPRAVPRRPRACSAGGTTGPGNFHKHRGMRIDLVLLSSRPGRPGRAGPSSTATPARARSRATTRPLFVDVAGPGRRLSRCRVRPEVATHDVASTSDLTRARSPPAPDGGPDPADLTGPAGPGSAEWPRLLHEFATAPPSPRRAELHRTGHALRRIVHRLHGSPAPADELAAAADELERLADRLDAFPKRSVYEGFGESTLAGRDPHAFFDHSPMLGRANPLAPPISSCGPTDDVLRGRAHVRVGLRGPARLRARRVRGRRVRRGAGLGPVARRAARA